MRQLSGEQDIRDWKETLIRIVNGAARDEHSAGIGLPRWDEILLVRNWKSKQKGGHQND